MALRPLNPKARRLAAGGGEVKAYAGVWTDCGSAFAPGWEVGVDGHVDPCPWLIDLPLCWSTCYWTGQVPDAVAEPTWMDNCQNYAADWTNLCSIPD